MFGVRSISFSLSLLLVLVWTCLLAVEVESFVSTAPKITPTTSTTTTTSLFAVSSLVRKAKETELRKELKENGIPDEVMEQYKIIQEALKKEDSEAPKEMGPLQQSLTRRKGTITVIAEYKRKIADGANGYIRVNADSKKGEASVALNQPILLSSEFREFGAAGIAVLADNRMGGCDYEDLKTFIEEQRRSKNEVPGPVGIINSDVIVDEVQIAKSAVVGATAVLLDYELLSGQEDVVKLARAARAVNLEVIVAVRSKEEAQTAIDAVGGSFMISVVGTTGIEEKVAVIDGLEIADDVTISTIANILHRSDQGLAEVEEAWSCRDKGFNCAWVSDALYKAGNSQSEHPGAIIRSMAAKSSVRWASPVAKSGRGEGAKEYLGDIMM
jgi:indole-3-glycerol phosphate synthase